jgi:hypothetical protein
MGGMIVGFKDSKNIEDNEIKPKKNIKSIFGYIFIQKDN